MNIIPKLIVLIEIPKLSVPFSSSFKIQDNKNTFYLYPGTFTQTLKEYNDELSRIHNDPTYNGFHAPGFEFYFDKNQERFAYIASEIDIDLNISREELFDRIRIFFRPLITIFSFFISEIFTINKVYFFEKKSWGCEFIQTLESPDFHKELSEYSKIKQFISQHDVEFLFPCILTRMCGKEHYLEFVDGYIVGKIKSFFIGNKISNYWNCLEHFSNKYCTSIDKNRILIKNVNRQLNRIVNGAIGLIKDDDVAFPDLSINEIKSKGWLLGDNRPPIINRILYMFKRKRINLSDEEKKIIKILNEVRNKLYHEENYLTRLLGRLARRFHLNSPTLLDIGLFTKKFSLIVEKMILGFFKIIPNYFELKQEEYYHSLKNIEMNLPTLRTNEELRQEYHNKRFNMEGLTEREIHIKHLVYDKKDLTQRGKYIPIIKYLDRLKSKIQEYIQENYFSGIFNSPSGSLDAMIKFNDNLNGSIEFLTRNRREIVNLMRSELLFISNINPQFNNFRIKFVPMIKKISNIIGGNDNPTGKFFTFMIEIKEIDEL